MKLCASGLYWHDYHGLHTIQQFKDAYDKKKITDDDLNLAVARLFAFRLVRLL